MAVLAVTVTGACGLLGFCVLTRVTNSETDDDRREKSDSLRPGS